MPSKVGFDPKEPSLGRIRVDSVAPPHTPASIKRCISRVERNPVLAWPGHADLFADTSCETPLKEGHISLRRCPGLNPNEPMAIVQLEVINLDGKHLIKNRAADIYWCAGVAAGQTTGNQNSKAAYYVRSKFTMEYAKTQNFIQVNNLQLFKCSKDKTLSKWDITRDADGNISMTPPCAPSLWVGADMTESTAPVPWRLIPVSVNRKFY